MPSMEILVPAVCVLLSVFSFIGAAVAYGVSAYLAYLASNAAHGATPAAQGEQASLIPAAGDIAKVLDSLKGIIDSLSKASPLVAWLVAAMIFAGIAAYSVQPAYHSNSDTSNCCTAASDSAKCKAGHTDQKPVPSPTVSDGSKADCSKYENKGKPVCSK